MNRDGMLTADQSAVVEMRWQGRRDRETIARLWNENIRLRGEIRRLIEGTEAQEEIDSEITRDRWAAM